MTRALLLLLLVATTVAGEGTSTTYEWLPARPTGGATTAWPTANVLRCTAMTPQLSISNATQMAWFVSGGLGGGGLCSFTIYSADGSTQIVTSGAVDCSATGSVAVTGLSAFALTAGTKVQVCTCANANGGSYLSASSATAIITTMQNALATPIGTQAANACTAGAAPSTTGALSPSAVNVPVLIVSVSTTTTTTITTTTTTTTSTTTTT